MGQPVASVLSSLFGGAFTTSDRPGEPPIVPAGWAFSFWGVVMALSLGWAVWSDRTGTGDAALRDRLTRPLLVTFAGFSVWIAAAEIEPVWATVVVFAVMLGGLLVALRVALDERVRIAAWPRLGSGLLWGLLGAYTGWSSIAIWINLTTALAESGAPIDGPVGVAGQLAVLAGAVATAVALLRASRGLAAYAVAAAWALFGALIGALGANAPVLAAAAGLGLVAVLVATVTSRRSSSAAT